MINSDGVLSFKFSPDYEVQMGGGTANDSNTYKVVVAASDDAAGADNDITVDADKIKVAYKKVTVMVTKVEETETVTLSALQGQVDVALTATYNDLDKEGPDAADLTWKWSLGGSEIDGASNNTYVPTRSGTLRVEASYTKADGTKKAVSKTVRVRVAPDAGNVTPKFGEGAGARSVDENSPPGTRVGAPVAAIDPGDILTYTLSTNPGDRFEIDQATGQITVGARTTLDTEDGASYTVTVTATDPAGLGATPTGAAMQDVVITVKRCERSPDDDRRSHENKPR